MKLKLDENLGTRCADILRAAGHDVATVAGQSMTSSTDVELIEACRTEGRALVTLDLDFSNPLVFPPDQYAGIAVLRLRPRPTHADLIAAARTLVGALAVEQLSGKLWSVETGRVRIYQPPDPQP
jgi:predicted nuclease of predicted toxin-antitoxin system